MTSRLLRSLPSIDRWLSSAPGQALCAEFSRPEVRAALRMQLDALRRRIADGAGALPAFEDAEFEAQMRAALLAQRRGTLRNAINATGIIVHTNLGRAPLAPHAVAAIEAAGRSYSNLELRLETGQRGARNEHVEALIMELTAAEAALVVNNCAGAVLLVLAAFAQGREVIVSRGELIEIGGSFRMPDVIAASGARMIEVGTTNRTTLGDYERAIGAQASVLLVSHPSNYRVIGFTTKPQMSELVALAHARGCLCVHDLGSGCLVDLAARGLAPEPTVAQAIATGMDLVLFSGDKLLGGPQAGIIAGRRELVDRLRESPLARALRIDKLSLAGLRATLELYRPPHDPFAEVPVLRMLTMPRAALDAETDKCVAEIRTRCGPEIDVEAVASSSFTGGGTLPMHEIASVAVRLRRSGVGADALAQRLRTGEPAVVARIHDDAVLLDLRTVRDRERDALVTAVVQALTA